MNNSIIKIQSILHGLNEKISHQLHAILHHPRFQTLEASWRGLSHLVAQSNPHIAKVKILDTSLAELIRDFNKTSDIEHTALFGKIYHHEFSQAGGEPFGLLLGDYFITQEIQHLHFVSTMSKIAQSAFAPFITGISPQFFEIASFDQLRKMVPHHILQTKNQDHWLNLRKQEATRFLGLILPRLLIRSAHTNSSHLKFHETIATKQNQLWCNAIYGFGGVIQHAFLKTRWFLNALDADNQPCKALSLNRDKMHSTFPHPINKYLTETILNIACENQLAHAGLIYLKECKFQTYLKFSSAPSYFTSSKSNPVSLLSILCLSRFAHYIKMIMRNKLGVFQSPIECEHYLEAWLRHYTADVDQLDESSKAKYPLRTYQVKVKHYPGSIKKYQCEIELALHTQIQAIAIQLKLITEIDRS